MSIRMNSPLFLPMSPLSRVCGLWPVCCRYLTWTCCLSVPNKGLCAVFTEQNINQWYGKEMGNVFQQKSSTEFYREVYFWLTPNSTQNHTNLSNQEHTAFRVYGIFFLKLVLTHWLVSADKYIHTHAYLLWVRGVEVHNLGLKLCTSLGCKSWLCGKGKAWWGWFHCSHKGRSEWSRLST